MLIFILFRIEPHVEPVNGIVQPPVYPPPNRPGRITNQLHYLKTTIIKGKKRYTNPFDFVPRPFNLAPMILQVTV